MSMNNYTLNNFFMFALGAAIGSVVTWKLIKTKYEQIANDEIASVKEVFSNRKTETRIENTESETASDDIMTMDEYKKILDEHYSNNPVKEEDYRLMEVNENIKPYVIAPDEFGELDGYESESLTYYADGVLADDFDNVIEDVERLVGRDSLNHFGEYEDDSVFVRNDRYKTDYEILLDTRNYSDAVANSR